MNRQLIKMLKGLSTAMVVLSILFAFLISGVRILGFDVFGVLTGSMEPAYPVGSLIYVKPVDAQELRVNDVITFSVTPGVIATHRIVEVVPDENNPLVVRYRTKGDANNDVDAALVSAGNIVGKVMFCVPALGQLASYIQEPPGLYVAIAVCGLMIAFVFFTDSLDENQKKRKKKSAKKKSFDWAPIVNPISEMILGRPLIRRKRVRKKLQEDESFTSVQRPQRTAQTSQIQRVPQTSQFSQAPQTAANPQRYAQSYAQPQPRPEYGYSSQQQYRGYSAQNPQYPPYGTQQGYSQQPYYPQQAQRPAQPQYQQPQYQRTVQQQYQQPMQQPYYPQQAQRPAQQPYQQPVQQQYQPQYQRPAQPYQQPAQQPYQRRQSHAQEDQQPKA